MKWQSPIGAGVSILMWTIAGVAAEGEIAPDRPGMTDPPGVLRRGILQTELGTSVQWERHGEERTVLLTMGTPTLRLGLGGATELRFAGDGMSALRTDYGRRREAVVGHSDYSLGVKRQVWSEGKLRPLFSLIPSVSMPVGNRRFSSYAFAPGVKLSMSKDLWGDVSASGNLCWTASKDDLGRYAESVQTLSIERDVAWGFSAFGEGYRRRSEHRAGVPLYILDGGVTRSLNRNVVVDISAGRVVEAGPQGWFIGFGIAFRHFLPGLAN